jgi:glyoxylase-like metal-dependent hydrolase (beta-lactamase superfamily II)
MVKHIYNLGNRVANHYIVQTEQGCIIIDTGYPGGFARFKQGFESLGLNGEDIRFLFLTHAHDDHAGFLNEMLDYTKAPVIMDELSVERLRKGQNCADGHCSTKLAQLSCKMMGLFGLGEHRFPPVDRIDRYILFDGKQQPLREAGIDAEIIDLPGHTADSIGLLFDTGELFCGDAAMNGFPSTARHTIWIECVADFQRSWDRMIQLKPAIIMPAHGRPFPKEDLLKYRHFMDGRKLYRLQ